MMMVVCYDDGEDGGGGSGVVEVARGASGIVDRVDPEVGSVFGVGRKNPAGKVFWRWWWSPAGGRIFGRERVESFGSSTLFLNTVVLLNVKMNLKAVLPPDILLAAAPKVVVAIAIRPRDRISASKALYK
ncbi:hypothetical protein Tco_1090963 [Tanacetum coccineum]|uniref:Uncharacterized protein n=1 Tax=Tanacetum coccineum TaxID=301880 RepID=A0ABQ5I722_9ASTR